MERDLVGGIGESLSDNRFRVSGVVVASPSFEKKGSELDWVERGGAKMVDLTGSGGEVEAASSFDS